MEGTTRINTSDCTIRNVEQLTRLVSESISLCSSNPTKYSAACTAKLKAISGITLCIVDVGVDRREQLS